MQEIDINVHQKSKRSTCVKVSAYLIYNYIPRLVLVRNIYFPNQFTNYASYYPYTLQIYRRFLQLK